MVGRAIRTNMQIDKSTHRRLKELAKPRSVAAFLRDLSETEPTLDQQIKTLCELIIKRLDILQEHVDSNTIHISLHEEYHRQGLPVPSKEEMGVQILHNLRGFQKKVNDGEITDNGKEK